ncbi:MAG TPA: hypothetical protein VJ912_00805 [Candidatus Nanoarchaeia archaeon]|nr:hypothetical protein [Candidatus Nanoarchaeia archaeon]
MKKRLMFLFSVVLLMSLFLSVNVSAQEDVSAKRMNFKEIEDKAGTVPGEAFYFLDRTFDVFKSSEKLADERAYELAVLANKSAEGEEVKNRTMEKARERYEKTMEKVQRKTQNKEDASERVANATTKHLEVLSMVYEKVPEQAKGAIEKAMNRSMRGREEAISSLRQFNESKADKMQNMTNQRIQNRVSEEVRNRVKEMTGKTLGPGESQGPEVGQGMGSGAGPGSDEEDQETSVKVGQGGEAYETFKSYLEENPEYNVKYEITHSDGSTETVEIYTKNGETRIEGEDEEYILWVNGKSIVDYQGQCINLDSAKSYGIDPKSLYQQSPVKKGSIKSEDEYIDVSSIGTKNIAGKTTECFEFVYETEQYNQLTTYCVTDKGIPALVKTIDRDTEELQSESRATKLEDSVSDSVLEACEPNMEMPNF